MVGFDMCLKQQKPKSLLSSEKWTQHDHFTADII